MVDDGSDYGKGLAGYVKDGLGSLVVGNDTVASRSDRLLRDRDQGDKASGADADLLRRLLHRGRAAGQAAASGRLQGPVHVR